jgi:hypothetical protein
MPGQPQHGVDIYGRTGPGNDWAGVQCKAKSDALGTALTRKELLEEVEKAKGFTPALSEFTLVSTGPRDAELQAQARTLTDQHRRTGLFSVHVWAWEDVVLRLNDYPSVAALHFPAAPGAPLGIASHRGVLFTYDAAVDSWQPLEHPDACDCGRFEVHQEIRQLASGLVAAYVDLPAKSRHRASLDKYACRIVSLVDPTPGSLA